MSERVLKRGVCRFIFGDGVFIVVIVCSEATVSWQTNL